MKYKRTRQSGFTLVEVIIYTGLLTIVMGGFVAFSLTMVGLKSKNHVMEEINVNGRNVINILSSKIREAESVVNPGKGDTSTSLSLLMPNGSTITILNENGRLLLNNGTSSDSITKNEVVVSNLNFSNLSCERASDAINISFFIEYKNNSSMEYSYSKNFTTAEIVRN